MSGSPFAQFEIKPLVDFKLNNISLGYTNSALFMTIAALLAVGFMFFTTRKTSIIPSRLQILAEIIYEFIQKTFLNTVGQKNLKYFPEVFATFLFILNCNLLGILPHGFTVTSHISVCFAIAAVFFLFITITGIFVNGKNFLKLFMPAGTPLWLMPIMILIELFSYLARPLSLAVRLTSNMIAGHVLLKVIATLVVSTGVIGSVFALPLISILTGFEIFVALLQAYIFTILTCVYLNDALNLH
jgi:F-type H+-transporting ATPase subunit a